MTGPAATSTGTPTTSSSASLKDPPRKPPRPPSCSLRDGKQMDRRGATRFVMRPPNEAAIKTSPPRSSVVWHLCYTFAHDEGCIARLEKPHGRGVTSGVLRRACHGD